MIIVYAGRRPTDDGGVFPPSRAPYLEERVKRSLAGLMPSHVVGSAAAGSDLILLEAAASLGIPATIVIAGTPSEFAAGSVDDKPGWRDRFDAIIQNPNVAVESIQSLLKADDTYRAITVAIIDRAEALASSQGADGGSEEPLEVNDEQVLGFLMSAGSRGSGDHTEDLARRLKAAGHLTLTLDPKAGRESSPVAFVAMPFGERRDPTNNLQRYDSDATWQKLLLPALLASGYRVVRTDSEASRQLIDSRMILDLLGAQLVVADLATLNPNVFWELGVRHTVQRAGTLVISPAGAAPPFDVRSVPVHPYDRTAEGFSDNQIIDGLRALLPAIASVTSGQSHADLPESPVYAVVPSLSVSGFKTGSSAGTVWLEQISVASELGRFEELVQIDAALEDADLTPESKRALHVQIGFALIRLRQHGRAVDILESLVAEDVNYQEEELQQKYAHALIRAEQDEATRDVRLRLAELRLRELDERWPNSGETLGLLGSIAKERARIRYVKGVDAEGELRFAAESYRKGFTADPLDYYPGVNAVFLYRILGTYHQSGREQEDLAEARQLLPVVRFAVNRVNSGSQDVWAQATVGELLLQELLLKTGDALEVDDSREVLRYYRQAAVRANPQQISSIAAQLELMITFGDSRRLFQPILDLFESRGYAAQQICQPARYIL